LVEAVRAVVHEVVPEAEERGNSGWHSINYRHPEVGYFFGIFPLAEEVRLVFEWGTRLDDPAGILEGDTSRIKSVMIRSRAEFEEKRVALEGLLKQAIGLGNDRVPRVARGRRSPG
jgi:hypothetical protein